MAQVERLSSNEVSRISSALNTALTFKPPQSVIDAYADLMTKAANDGEVRAIGLPLSIEGYNRDENHRIRGVDAMQHAPLIMKLNQLSMARFEEEQSSKTIGEDWIGLVDPIQRTADVRRSLPELQAIADKLVSTWSPTVGHNGGPEWDDKPLIGTEAQKIASDIQGNVSQLAVELEAKDVRDPLVRRVGREISRQTAELVELVRGNAVRYMIVIALYAVLSALGFPGAAEVATLLNDITK